MAWIGKAVGGVFGYAILGPVGVLIGIFVGHLFDQQFSKALGHGVNQAEIQAAFFEALFLCMGHLAKRDGHVSENEIRVARQIMDHMQLSDHQRLEAMRLFTEGKTLPDTDFTLERFSSLTGRHKNVFRMFLQLELQAAYADGPPEGEPLAYLKHIAEKLGFKPFEFDAILRIFHAQYAFHYQRSGQDYSSAFGGNSQNLQKEKLKSAFGVLGVSEEASKEEVKKAYRKQMNQYHPDKLVAKGLPESMMKAATEKTQAIKEAYELINQVKGW